MSGGLDDEFAAWLATPPTSGLLVETLEMRFETGAAPIRIANRKHNFLQAYDELGLPRTYQPLPFTKSMPALRNSTELAMQARIDAVNGAILQTLANMTVDELDLTVTVIFRDYIDPLILDRPARGPYVLRLDECKVSMDVVELSMSGAQLPNRRAGLYYDLSRFVGLRPG